MAWYIRYLHRKYAANGVEAEETAEEAVTLRTLNAARQRLIVAQAATAELELQKARGQAVTVEVFQETLVGILMPVRQQLLALPGRVAPQLEGENRTVIKTRLQHAVQTALAALAAWMVKHADSNGADPEQPSRSDSGSGAADGSPAKPARQRVGRAQPSPA
ncbi:MAG: hypothetical protein L0387_01200 [Acidobacteria bacterium]|nr:hypothetical protein [Acidobacteriota bacterium]